MKLELERGFTGETNDPDAVRTALQTLSATDNTFAILSSGDETYIQTGVQDDGFIVEKRDGSSTDHFYAARPGLHQPLKDESLLLPTADRGQDRFTLAEVQDIFVAYMSGNAPSTSVQWVRMKMYDADPVRTKVRWAFWIIVIVGVSALSFWLKWKS